MFINNKKPDGPTTSEYSVGACKAKLHCLHITNERRTFSTQNRFGGLQYIR